jgi:diguanylate cyclase (GGDEF)-like protein
LHGEGRGANEGWAVTGAAQGEVEITEADHAAARAQIRASSRGTLTASVVVQSVLVFLAAVLAERIHPRDGTVQDLVVTALAIGMALPFVLFAARTAIRKTHRDLVATLARERHMRADSRRRSFETRLANALEMAETEPEALEVGARALATDAPDIVGELLLADNSHAHLARSFVVGRDPTEIGCAVESPARCVAARRGQTQYFDDSDALDACPKLRDRPSGRCAAVCVPLSIMGRSVGVLHLTEPVPDDGGDRRLPALVDRAELLTHQLGGRLGMLRVMAESQLQASTDSLTGLPNRRTFENEVRRLRQTGVDHCVVMADLDHFKRINDTFGHEAGDRALRVFARVVREAVRPQDLVCRYGGEEFALALPVRTADDAVRICDRIREELALALTAGSHPVFTASFGIAAPDGELSYEELVARADIALYQAKQAGRNRTVLHTDGGPVPQQVGAPAAPGTPALPTAPAVIPTDG